MRLSLTGVVGGLLGFGPFLAASLNVLIRGRGDHDEGVYVFVLGFTTIYAVAMAASFASAWIRPPVLFLVGMTSLLAALAAHGPLSLVFVGPAALCIVGAVTSAVALVKVWNE